MFLTIVFIASVTFLLPFIALINEDYLPEVFIPIASQMRLYLPDSFAVGNSTADPTAPVLGVDNIVKPTSEITAAPFLEIPLPTSFIEHIPTGVTTEDINNRFKDLFNIAKSYSDDACDFILKHTYYQNSVEFIGYYINLVTEFISHYANLAIENIKEIEDSLFFNDYVYPAYQRYWLPIQEYAEELLEKHYFSLSDESQENILKGLIVFVIMIALFLLLPVLKFIFNAFVKDAKEFHDSAKSQYKSTKTKNNEGDITKTDSSLDSVQKTIDEAVRKQGKSKKKSSRKKKKIASGYDNDNFRRSSSSFVGLNQKLLSVDDINEKILLRFRKSAETLVADKMNSTSINLELPGQEKSNVALKFEGIVELSTAERSSSVSSSLRDYLGSVDSDSEIAKSTFDSDDNRSSISSQDFNEHVDEKISNVQARNIGSFLQSSQTLDPHVVVRNLDISNYEIESEDKNATQNTKEDEDFEVSTVTETDIIQLASPAQHLDIEPASSAESDTYIEEIISYTETLSTPTNHDDVNIPLTPADHSTETIHFVPAFSPVASPVAQTISTNRLDGSPSKLIFKAAFNTTSGITHNNVYSAIILPQSPSKSKSKSDAMTHSPLKDSLDFLQTGHQVKIVANDASSSYVE
ncbi:hypothetical protein DASC09_003160 [Saccharomycopsis crataegensis]|uniref:Uncharacterized protein n=1 Tax=Saccharomycopsis crataegensis TaxID=43959 RepID=A0AAV5QE16_9ASCO|nr:hypothetical protein DASC09_003160 [Saccharomycopsis crataegensis]